MKKRLTTLLAILFLLAISAIVIAFILVKDISFSENENRSLQTMPKIGFSEFISGKLGKEMDAYMADQFPFREYFVGWKTRIQGLIGIRENNGVYLGDEGMLFQAYEERDLSENLEGINRFMEKYKIPTECMIIPTKGAVYPSRLPKDAPLPDERKIIGEIQKKLKCSVCSPLEIFRENQDSELYYFTDHHWNGEGTVLAYEKWCEIKGVTPLSREDIQRETVPNFYGALYSSGGYRNLPADEFHLIRPRKRLWVDYGNAKKTHDFIDEGKVKEKDKYAAYLGGNFDYLLIRTGNPGKRLLLIKDSFANALIPLLAEHYSEIHVVDLRYVRKSIGEKMNDVDEVLILYNLKNFMEDDHLRKLDL